MPVLKMNEQIQNVIPYKFSLGENVIYIDPQNGKAERGTIVAVQTYNDKYNKTVNYTLQHPKKGMIGNIPETVIFRTRDEALNWAITIANSIVT